MSWELGSFLVLGVALALGFLWYERSRPPARVLALVAALAALAVVGRLAFAALPNVKPTTDIVLFAGYALGGAPGFAVGSVTALVSNVFLTHGPWTPWQMAAWGGVGLAGGWLGAVVRARSAPAREPGASSATREQSAEPRELGRWSLALACGLAGLAYGLVMDLYLWTLAGEHSLAAYAVLSARSLPFNVAHALGNVAFALVIGPPLVRALRRYRRRFEVRWVPARAEMPAAVPARTRRTTALFVALALVAAGSLAGSPPVRAASPTDYLLSAQNCDGGFGAKRRDGSSNPLYTGWAALGLAAAGYNPQDVRRCGASIIDYVERTAGSVRSTGDLERTILVLRAAGLPPRLGRRDLESELLEARDPDGSFGTVNWTAFGVLAMRAAGSSDSLVRESADSLVECQNDEGGFGLTCAGGQSEVDYTAAVLQAMRAARGGNEDTTRHAVAYLADAQLGNGGFGQRRGSSRANTQNTAWAAQGLEAAGAESRADRGRRYLRSQQASDGCIRSPTSTPVWATGDAMIALSGKYLPLDPVSRRGRAPRPPLHNGPECGEASETPPASTPRPRPADDTDRSPRGGDGARPKEPAVGGGAGPGTGAGKGAGAGAGAGAGSGDGSGSGVGAGPASGAGGDAAGPPTAGAQGAAEGETSPRAPDIGLAPTRHLAGAAATGSGLSAGAARSPAAGRAFSDAGPLPLARASARAAPHPGAREGNPGSLPGLLIIGAAAAALFAATAGAARLRRLWAVIRRRTA